MAWGWSGLGQTPLFGNEGSVGRGRGTGWGSQLASGLSESCGLHSERLYVQTSVQIRTAHTQTHIETCIDTETQTAPLCTYTQV